MSIKKTFLKLILIHNVLLNSCDTQYYIFFLDSLKYKLLGYHKIKC